MNRPIPEPALALRAPDEVMRLECLGASHPTRLSFLRTLMRRAAREGWRFTRPLWEIDAEGYGRALYQVDTGARSYCLVAFSHYLPEERRTDRVIAEAWDTSYALYDGVPDRDELDRLEANVPRQEAGRFTARELTLSRANKSVRLFDSLVATLASGVAPGRAAIDAVGYLMRTTAVYGNGKFGIADRDVLRDRPELGGPFQAEMLTVWLIRSFTLDLAEHCARALGGDRAVPLEPDLRRRIGVGNSTGLGMAPFLVRHPTLLHAWIHARETALARVRALPDITPGQHGHLLAAIDRAREVAGRWTTIDAVQSARIAGLRADLDRLHMAAVSLDPGVDHPCDRLYRFARVALGLEAREYAAALLIEPFGALVDDLADTMAVDEDALWRMDGTLPAHALLARIDDAYGWAAAIDFADPASDARFWYVSADKLEPRLGERREEPGADREQPLAIARDVMRLRAHLATLPPERTVAEIVLERPDWRHVVQRVLLLSRDHLYGEVRDNLLSAALRPIDLLRCKLAFFGADQFDPRSDRWLRISMFRGAPFPEELSAGEAA
ncbi:hypothetical protein [Ancylobacter amanitiformis]|uniref:Uncharacterized protein n=1 Tax=Ancylobacter amanitiformis TaxID=217069 RepID=A0ABU0LVE1_9HYPH|nr:hypothetical protein [Ancylobacter amanitiformis]MDQ0512630.1 hypothetical protein [Ancylobacter amanitiformis]